MHAHIIMAVDVIMKEAHTLASARAQRRLHVKKRNEELLASLNK
jgi:hypothetical protein